jgi:sugar lactone lactonase YvrE
LLDVAEVPYAHALVTLQAADGTAILDTKGQPVQATTDASGSYQLNYSGNTSNLVIHVALPAQKGELLALAPKGLLAKPGTVDLNLTSTLVMGYILSEYVQNQVNRQGVFDKLPGDVEADTRVKTSAALNKGSFQPPLKLGANDVVGVVNQLRQQDKTIDLQLDYVRSLLLAGLPNQGIGLPANTVDADALDVAVGPTGALAYAGRMTYRVWTVDTGGLLQPLAGDGTTSPQAAVPQARAADDGGPAIAAKLTPIAIAYDAKGTLYILDALNRSIRTVDAKGIITTFVSHVDFNFGVQRIAFAPDGALLVATAGTLDRVAPDKTVTRLAGADVPPAGATDNGDNGPPAGALFTFITGIAVDPKSGDIYIQDGQLVRRIHNGLITSLVNLNNASGPGGATILRGGLAVDAQGNLLIADSAGFKIYRLAANALTVIAGSGEKGNDGESGPATSAQLLYPSAMALGPAGALYFVDEGLVRKLTGDKLATIAGRVENLDAPRPAGVVNISPNYLAFDAKHNTLLFTDTYGVRQLDLAANTISTVAGSAKHSLFYADGAAPLAFSIFGASGLAPQPDGSLYFAPTMANNYSALLQLKDGVTHVLAGAQPTATTPWSQYSQDGPANAALVWPLTIFTQVKNDFYLAAGPVPSLGVDAASQPWLIRRLDPTAGTLVTYAGGGNLTAEGTPVKQFQFSRLRHILADPGGRFLYAAEVGAIDLIDLQTDLVTRYTGTGVAGQSGDGQNAHGALMFAAGQMAFDPLGNLCFSEYSTARVRRIDKATHTLATIAGTGSQNLIGTTVDTSLSGPLGIAFDAAGNLYIADRGHGQIKKVAAGSF